ncbi:hypothetical protein SAMN05421866_2139 [Chryseobacterium oranimense]|uniref:Uncharacterized protein n=1 Tax=Chryseobacterium oranimense TaxID=421058 RepID=A0A1M5Q8R3_9FLAO|nr:hypothetical protein [Chryseobacterium oranimense]SHH10378.1 hypothetical protein SAMN05421866_2139 [Chryseobacterium oranimense]
METIIRNYQQLQYAEVYISDIPSLKNIFLQVQNSSKLTKEFGVPFLLVKKKNQIVGFASLIINGKGEISFTIYGKNELSDSEKRDFNLRAERYFKQNNSGNFRNADQLKSSIERMIAWLNVG